MAEIIALVFVTLIMPIIGGFLIGQTVGRIYLWLTEDNEMPVRKATAADVRRLKKSNNGLWKAWMDDLP
jgi:hypothetical protein